MSTNQDLSAFGNRQEAPPLVTLAEVKSWLNIPDTDSRQDLVLGILIKAVSQEFENYVDGPIMTATIEEVIDGDSSDSLVLSLRPVRQIQYLFVDPTGQFANLETPEQKEASALKVDPATYFLRDDGCIVMNGAYCGIDFWSYAFGYGKGSIMVQYKSGYADTTTTVPGDIKLAALQRVQDQLHLKQNQTVRVKTKSSGEASSVAYELGLPTEIEQVLDRYKDYSFHKSNQRIRKYYEI